MPARPLPAEPLIGVNQAAALVACGRHSVVRWIKVGARGPGGVTVRLAGWRCGGTWKTTAAALAEFVAATTGGDSPPAPARTPAAARRASEAAERALIAKGL